MILAFHITLRQYQVFVVMWKKQHNIDNKVTSGNKSDNTLSCQDDHFSQIFSAAYQSSPKNIANDPFLPSQKISNINVIIRFY
jgi:hypothetical protein